MPTSNASGTCLRWFRGTLLSVTLASVAPGLPASSAQLSARQSAAASQTPTSAAPTAAPTAAAPTALVFTNVTVIDVINGQLLPRRTVVIAGNRVRAVGPSGKVRVPRGAQVVDARDKYLIPGLWNMHTHIDDNVHRYPQIIAHGVTGIREMAQRFAGGADSFRMWQREVAAGTRVGPRSVGPSVDLSSQSYWVKKGAPQPELVTDFVIATPEDARRIIDSLKAAGVAFLKHHGAPSRGGDLVRDRDLFFAAMRHARRVGLPVVGHIPDAVTNVEGADSGLRSVEHIHESLKCWPGWPKRPVDNAAEAEARCKPMADAYIRNGTWVTPTLYIWNHGFKEDKRPIALKAVQVLHRLGVRRFLAGTDNFANPGASLPEELVYLTEAGLTPLEALQAATLHPAQFFEATDSLGTVAPGKVADLVLLDGNPLTDIRNVMRIRAVVANGRYLDRPVLDNLLH